MASVIALLLTFAVAGVPSFEKLKEFSDPFACARYVHAYNRKLPPARRELGDVAGCVASSDLDRATRTIFGRPAMTIWQFGR